MSMSLVQAESASAHQAMAAVAALFPQPGAPGLADQAAPAAKSDGRLDLPLDELSFHRLGSSAEIAQIVHLRGEIQLPAAALADPSFHTREKKETNTGL
ncbi:MAG: hypothetical protein NVS3B2_02880 [Ramlibacter sp.]